MVTWGVIGCGGIAKTFMASVSSTKHGKVLGCAARDLSRAQDFAKQYDIQKAYGNYSDLLSDSSIDAVYIATTHNSHYENVMACLLAGKHVLCEKPITINAEQAKILFTEAKVRGLLLVEAVWTRFLPATIALQEKLNTGVIGEVLSLNATFAIQGNFDDSHRLKNRLLAGGSLLDLGIYPITMAYLVFGEAPIRIQSSAVIGDTHVDERAYILFDYSNGRNASLTCSFSHHAPTEAIIGGSEGYMRVPEFLGAKSFTVYRKDADPHVYEFPYAEGENFKAEIEDFQHCLASGLTESNVISADQSIMVMETMDTLRLQWGLNYPDEIENT